MSGPLRRMTWWRRALGVLVGLVLPLPLLLVLGGVMWARPTELSPGGRRVSPVLGFEARLNLVTYERECRKGADCEEPLGCLRDLRTTTRYCIDSECANDEQCPEGHSCQALPTLDEGPLVRYCIPWGVRKEGEKCFRPPSEKGEACAPGLVCAGAKSWCGRPCEKGAAASCPAGFFCADVAPRSTCLPTCEASGCPEGQQCIHYKEGVSRCAQVYGTNCQRAPCTNDRKCDVFDAAEQPDKVWMECVERCGKGRPSCAEGLACDVSRCRPACNPQVPHACGEGFRCERTRPESPWVCQPAW